MAYYRLMLPALPSKPDSSHRGIWKAVLGLKRPDEILGRSSGNFNSSEWKLAEFIRRVSEFTQKPTPFNLTASH